MAPNSARPDPAAQAATWYARLHADDATPADRMAFDRWLAADAVHGDAWDRVTRTAHMLDAGRHDPALQAMIAAARGGGPAVRRRWWPAAAAAAVVLAVGGGAVMLLDRPATTVAPQVAETRYATPVGRTREVALADGTQLTLDAASAVRVAAPGAIRRVVIEHGQAFFKVAHDPAHPFVVVTGRNSVTALGTAFAVRTAPDRVVVSLVEGSVRVDTPAIRRVTTLSPGNTLTIGRAGLQLATSGADSVAGWRRGELTFDATPLGEVAAELNRYSAQRIEIASPALARRVFSGVLKTDGGGRALADALGAYGIARVAVADPTRLVLAPVDGGTAGPGR